MGRLKCALTAAKKEISRPTGAFRHTTASEREGIGREREEGGKEKFLREYKKRASERESGAFAKVTPAVVRRPAAAMGKVLVITADRVT